jgi:CheY-like chemotaxis protein
MVFYADDDVDDHLLMQEAFEQAGLPNELLCASDGQELLDCVRQRIGDPTAKDNPPRLILLDLNMPRKDGREALKEVKGDRSLCNIPVVILTTSSAEQDITQSRALGASDFFTKPTDFKALCEIVARLRARWIEPEVSAEAAVPVEEPGGFGPQPA